MIKNQGIEFMRFVLLTPIAMCVFGGWLAHTSLPGINIMRSEVARLSTEFGQDSYPDLKSLISFTDALRVLLLFCVIGMIILWTYVEKKS